MVHLCVLFTVNCINKQGHKHGPESEGTYFHSSLSLPSFPFLPLSTPFSIISGDTSPLSVEGLDPVNKCCVSFVGLTDTVVQLRDSTKCHLDMDIYSEYAISYVILLKMMLVCHGW